MDTRKLPYIKIWNGLAILNVPEKIYEQNRMCFKIDEAGYLNLLKEKDDGDSDLFKNSTSLFYTQRNCTEKFQSKISGGSLLPQPTTNTDHN